MATGAELRTLFLDYFKSKDHKIVKSSPLVPASDRTLLFTNAGMVQFKDIFISPKDASYKRAASSQKCLRVSGKHNDLETVGRTFSHHTFFEMLGNFSFGDYFKREAIAYAWEFVTDILKIDKEIIYLTVFKDDDESFNLWKDITGFRSSKIVKLGEKDNFWSMGNYGPCGPCSEVYVDSGEQYGCGKPGCAPGCDCSRYMEIWNLVFMMYNKSLDGHLTDLELKSIDTGMGLERITAFVNGKRSNFETDLIYPIIEELMQLGSVRYKDNEKTDVALKIIADHLRSITFLISENLTPGNEGRGYVLRRLIRRAFRYGKSIGIESPFLYKLTDKVVDIFGKDYPEVESSRKIISDLTELEERSFEEKLEGGLSILKDLIERSDDILDGDQIFKLYDTYGFPLDLAKEIAEESGRRIDEKSFNQALQRQRDEARSKRKDLQYVGSKILDKIDFSDLPETEFIGYDIEESEEKLLGIISDDSRLESIKEGEEGYLVFGRTPFYHESGGQVSDKGEISSKDKKALVEDLIKIEGKYIVHKVRMIKGELFVGETLKLEIDKERRKGLRRAHTATHLLHAALRKVIGSHIKQGGSLVDNDRLRFDYSHYEPISDQKIKDIEFYINDAVISNIALSTDIKDYDEAVSSGAMALFGEKYKEKVRVVSIADISVELCGGTHVFATGDISVFKIVSEAALASGVRRIEGYTGKAALEYIMKEEDELKEAAKVLKGSIFSLASLSRKLLESNHKLSKEVDRLKEKLIKGGSDSSSDPDENKIKIKDKLLIVKKVDEADPKILRSFVDDRKSKYKDLVVIVFSSSSDKAMVAVGVSESLKALLSAKEIVSRISSYIDGSGGGRDDFAQAGGKNILSLKEGIDALISFVKERLS